MEVLLAINVFSQFSGNALEFEVDNKLGFEVPLSHVSHTTTAKQEVTLEFHPNDDAAVSLMELRFHIPPDPKDTEKDLVQVGVHCNDPTNGSQFIHSVRHPIQLNKLVHNYSI